MNWENLALLSRFAGEVLVFSAVIYAFIRFLQETQGSAVFKGFVSVTTVFLVGLPLLADVAQMEHLAYLTDNGLTILMLSLVVIFSPELRQALVRLGENPLLSSLGTREKVEETAEEEIVQATERLARRGLGALLILERRIGIASFTEGGVPLDAKVTAPLLVSIFFKDTPLHDGAAVIRGRRIVAAGCFLPLTENPNVPKALGTRHRAAIGATEENDAVAIVVSEETQLISIVRQGRLERGVKADRLLAILRGEEEDPAEGAARSRTEAKA